MQFNDERYKILAMTDNSCSCYKLCVDDSNRKFADYLRELFIHKVLAQGYLGYDRDYDEQYQAKATYFYLRETTDNRISMIMRVNLAEHCEYFPFELGVTETGETYRLEPRNNTMDMNTYYCDTKLVRGRMKLLMTAIATFKCQNGVKRTFGLVDVERPSVEKFYTNQIIMKHAEEYNPLKFSSYVHKDRPKGVYWRVLEWEEQGVIKLSQNIRNYEQFYR